MIEERRNVVILTNGLTGSSVLTGLIARAGYWTGEETCRKPDYDTHENQKLIELNKRIMAEAGYLGDHSMWFSQEGVDLVAKSHERVNLAQYREFIRVCESHRPWIWKDPRLPVTIRFWKRIMDLKSAHFLLLTRDSRQLWISTNLRHQIQTFEYCNRYQEAVKASIMRFFEEEGVSNLELVFEDLICKPEATLRVLNAYLGTELTVDDLKKVYFRPLYHRRRGAADFIKATLVYLRNYPQRYRSPPPSPY